MGYWLKRFADGSRIKATDQDVDSHLASWSRERLDGMIGAELGHDNHLLRINGAGEYWQSDTYESVFPFTSSQIIKRRIEKKICEDDTLLYYQTDGEKMIASFNSPLQMSGLKSVITIVPENIGHWLVLEYNVKTNALTLCTRNERS